MGRIPPTAVRQLANETGISNETTEFAADMADAVSRSGAVDDSLPSAIAAGCLHAAVRALGAEISDARSRCRESKPNHNWNHQVGHNRSDNGSTEMTISKAASITPASLRKHSREAATIYLDSDAEMADARTRQRLTRLTLR